MAFSWKPIAVCALLAASALTAPAVAGVTTASAAPAPAPAADPQPLHGDDIKDVTLDGRKVDTTVRYHERARAPRRADHGVARGRHDA